MLTATNRCGNFRVDPDYNQCFHGKAIMFCIKVSHSVLFHFHLWFTCVVPLYGLCWILKLCIVYKTFKWFTSWSKLSKTFTQDSSGFRPLHMEQKCPVLKKRHWKKVNTTASEKFSKIHPIAGQEIWEKQHLNITIYYKFSANYLT